MSGFTGPDDGLQEAKGLYTSRGVEVDAAPILEGLGEVYHLSEILYKGHASCMQAQAGVHGLLALTQDITPEQVAAVRVGLPKKAFVVVETQGVPANHTAAGAHGPYLMAAALLHRKILPAQFEDECLRDERMHALMRRVTVLEDPALEQYRDGWPARVEVELIDGSLRQTELAGWMGEGAEERRVFVAKKFATTMAITTGASRAGEILDCVMGLDEDKTPSMLLAATGTQEGG